MLSVFGNPTYRLLFASQAVALLGTGLLTVGLGLLAFDLAGTDAGVVLGTALAIKMVAFVVVSPFAGVLADFIPRRILLVSMDLVRAGIALTMPFVTEVWQIYLSILLLQAASALFTPVFQATIPDILPDEEKYTRALSLARLLSDVETLLSPVAAALLLTVMNFHWLFVGTVIGFAISAALVIVATLPRQPGRPRESGIYWNMARGLFIFLKTPRLQGLMALSMSGAWAGAMVIVNTVVIVKGLLGFDDDRVMLALACYGGGSFTVALLMPKILSRLPDRTVMLTAAGALGLGLAGFGVSTLHQGIDWPVMLGVWVVLGAGCSALFIPTGRLLRHSAAPEDRPVLFATQFALSHACWLLTYPLAGWLGRALGIGPTLILFASITLVCLAIAILLWPYRDPIVVGHVHPELPTDHPHMKTYGREFHAHPYMIDDLHKNWPRE